MHNSYRECPQCQAPIEGRPNKKFCSDFCKGRHFRENNALEDDSCSLVSQQPIRLSAANYSDTKDSELDWEEQEEERQEQEKKVRAAEEQAGRLHEQFCDLVNEFLQLEGKILTERPVNTLSHKIDRLTVTYRQHPYIKIPGNLVRSRLNELYSLYDILQKEAQWITDKSASRNEEEYFGITKKSRKQLRKLLIAD